MPCVERLMFEMKLQILGIEGNENGYNEVGSFNPMTCIDIKHTNGLWYNLS